MKLKERRASDGCQAGELTQAHRGCWAQLAKVNSDHVLDANRHHGRCAYFPLLFPTQPLTHPLFLSLHLTFSLPLVTQGQLACELDINTPKCATSPRLPRH